MAVSPAITPSRPGKNFSLLIERSGFLGESPFFRILWRGFYPNDFSSAIVHRGSIMRRLLRRWVAVLEFRQRAITPVERRQAPLERTANLIDIALLSQQGLV